MGEEAYYPSRLPRQPVSTRDRYRNTQQYGYDDVEDGDEFEGGGVEFDSFDDRVLRQAFPDRQRQVEQGGRARLSLAPASGLAKGPGGANLSYPAREHGEHEYRTHVELSARVQPSRFAYNANHHTESSSDVPLGPSSSPTLKARNRRVEYPPSTTGHHGGLLQDDGAYVAERRADQLISRLQGRHKPPQRSPSKNEQSQCDTDAYEYPTVAPTVTDLRLAKPQPKLMCQGIQLVPVSSLPDRLRTVFPYPTFNAVQSKCFDTVFMSDDNFVLSSPTGSGKTVILELAICRAIATNATGQYKIVYQAPTKALCSERQRDWEAKFTPIGLRCAELTGDSDAADVRNVQSANIIVTTPEKWDSITRKWKDYEKLMRLVKIFLIDEVHILNEDRGAVLEVVVSRMKSIGTDVRFVALSATVPNFHDVATWLGKNPFEPHLPAASESFGEEFRPVKLQKHVCGYVSQASNDFGFEKLLDAKLPEVITKYSEGKPIMIFCATRKGCEATAKLIANWWITRPVNNRKWKPPTRQVLLRNKGLQETVASGVAFHHAGLNADDRMQVEKGFLSHDINVICCTSTLAVGINLPCHLVIVKNTVSYTNAGLQEYSDLEMMQMLGRAGRPQFDDTAVAVIMTRQAKARQYESMVAGRDMLESTLHSNLVDHMNAEIGLGTIRDLKSARKWLGGTFLYVRLQHNPAHYKLANARSGQSIEEQVDDICFRDISLLREHNLVLGDEHFRSTEFGHAMARYYVHFETMKVFMGIQPKATPSEILSAIAQASEFSQIRFRAGEKPFYKLINKAPTVRFSIPVNLDLPAHKVSLIIQAILGAADISFEGGMAKHRSQYTMETQIVFKNVGALIRCIIDCQICLGDSVGIHNALMLERSLGARIWDDSPLQMKQIEGIGVVYVRKLANAGIRSMEDLEACDPHRIETLVSRNPPFGLKVLEMVKAFPKLRVSLYAQPSSAIKCPDGVKIQVKADIGFINEKPPQRFAGKLVYVCLLAETSDGRKVHFARIGGPKLGQGQTLNFSALLTEPDQSINCYVMCDSIAGSLRGATVKPQITPSMFPATQAPEPDTPQRSNTSKRRAEPVRPLRKRSGGSDEFGDDEFDEEELVKMACGDLEFEHIDNFANPFDTVTRKNTAKNKSAPKAKNQASSTNRDAGDTDREPVQLTNGRWACKHGCKDKQACKHFCCKNGMDKPQKKPSAIKRTSEGDDLEPEHSASNQMPKATQSKLQLTASKRKISSPIQELDLTQEGKKKTKSNYAENAPREIRELHRLHNSVQKKDPPSTLHTVMHTRPAYFYSHGGDYNLSFLQQPSARLSIDPSDYGDNPMDDMNTYFQDSQPKSKKIATTQRLALLDDQDFMSHSSTARVASCGSDTFGDDDLLLGDAMVGLADSQKLQASKDVDHDIMQPLQDALGLRYEVGFHDDEFPMDFDYPGDHGDTQWQGHGNASTMPLATDRPDIAQESHKTLAHSTNSVQAPVHDLKSVKALRENSGQEEPRELVATQDNDHPKMSGKRAEDNMNVLDLLDMFERESVMEEKPVPQAFKGLEPWLFQEFGDIVELVDD